MNKIVNGWGVWLESVEITDVKILSKALFENLQTEFRESQRQKAEIIMMNTTNELNEKRLKIQLDKQKVETDYYTETQIFKANEQLKVQGETQKLLQIEQEINKLKIDSEISLKKHREQKDLDFILFKDDLYYANEMNTLELNKKKAIKNRELTNLKAESNKLNVLNQMKIRDIKAADDAEKTLLEGELQNKIIN